MGDWAQKDGTGLLVGDVTAASPYGVVLPNSGVNLTYGAWTTITATVPYETQGLYVCAVIAGTINGNLFFDLGIGTAGNEVVIIQGAYVISTGQRLCAFRFPVQVPAGVRLAGRLIANSNTTGTVAVLPYFQRRGFADDSELTTSKQYGWNPATLSMTVVTPGAANVKGAWTQITAATTAMHQALAVELSQMASAAQRAWRIDVGVGAGGSEQVLLADLNMDSTAAEPDFVQLGPFRAGIPSGTRLSARCMCTLGATATIGVMLRCFS
jgi:hypothetical protein